MSKLFTEGVEELRAEGTSIVSADQLDRAARAYLNQAAKLLDLEEFGVFRVWEADELTRMVRRAGFEITRTHRSFGTPPQAVVIAARRL